MAVKIRLMRIGTNRRPFYRVVAVDERKKRTGGYLELLGTYNPLTEPKEINLDQGKIDAWVKKGAQLSYGFLRIIGKAPQRAPRKPKKEPKAKTEAVPEAPIAEVTAAEPTAQEAPAENVAETTQEAPVEATTDKVETPSEPTSEEEVKSEEKAEEKTENQSA